MKTSPRYQLETWAAEHLAQWFASGKAPCAREQSDLSQARMKRFLVSQTPEDAAYWIDRGWTAVFDASTDA